MASRSRMPEQQLTQATLSYAYDVKRPRLRSFFSVVLGTQPRALHVNAMERVILVDGHLDEGSRSVEVDS